MLWGKKCPMVNKYRKRHPIFLLRNLNYMCAYQMLWEISYGATWIVQRRA